MPRIRPWMAAVIAIALGAAVVFVARRSRSQSPVAKASAHASLWAAVETEELASAGGSRVAVAANRGGPTLCWADGARVAYRTAGSAVAPPPWSVRADGLDCVGTPDGEVATLAVRTQGSRTELVYRAGAQETAFAGADEPILLGPGGLAAGPGGARWAVVLQSLDPRNRGRRSVLVATSLNGGATWAGPTALSEDGERVFHAVMPVVAAGERGALVAFVNEAGELQLRRSEDAGAHWTAAAVPRLVPPSGRKARCMSPTLRLDGRGRAHLAFDVAFQSDVKVEGGPLGTIRRQVSRHVLYSRSDDLGRSWSEPAMLTLADRPVETSVDVGRDLRGSGLSALKAAVADQRGTEDRVPNLDVSDDGTQVAVGWRDSTGDAPFLRLSLARSVDGGDHFRVTEAMDLPGDGDVARVAVSLTAQGLVAAYTVHRGHWYDDLAGQGALSFHLVTASLP